MIRRAVIEDAGAIAAIHVRAWQEAYAGIVPADFLAALSVEKRTEFWKRELGTTGSIVLASVEDGKVVGWASGGASRESGAVGECEIYAIYVSPKLWRQRIGIRLMKGIEEALRPSSDITLWVLSENVRAIDFYRSLGYEFDGTEKSVQLGGVSLDEIRLRKKWPNKAPEPTPVAVMPRA